MFLILAVDGGEWSDSRPGRLISGTPCIGGWMVPRASLGQQNPGRPARMSVVSHYAD
jgi:hypothetical protein